MSQTTNMGKIDPGAITATAPTRIEISENGTAVARVDISYGMV